MITGIKAFYFSATGGTKAVLDAFLRDAGESQAVCVNEGGLVASVAGDELAVFAAPVYEGRIVPVIKEKFDGIRGGKGLAVVLVAYGNRDYEDALIELRDIVEEKGFTVVAAAAFVAEHSVYARLAAGRPDARDCRIASEFGAAVVQKTASGNRETPPIKGNRPYKNLRLFARTPVCDEAKCNGCGVCVGKCPQKAIDVSAPTQTEPSLCMACVACVKYCSQGARQIPEDLRQKYEVFLEQFTAVRRESELFI